MALDQGPSVQAPPVVAASRRAPRLGRASAAACVIGVFFWLNRIGR